MQDKDDYKYKFTIGKLEKLSYRILQQKAKSLNLPSNFKKIYLIQLVHTHFFGSPDQVRSIVEHARRERQQLAQAPEISSTSDHPHRSTPATTRTPVIIRPIATRRVIKPDYLEPQPLGKPRAFALKIHPNEHTFGSMPPQFVNATSPKRKVPSSKPNLKQYRPNTAPLKTYVVRKKLETDRVLRNRTFPAANHHRPEKYKDNTADLDELSARYKDNASNVTTVSERHKDNTRNFYMVSESCKDNAVSERYRDTSNLNCTILDLLQSRRPIPEGNQLKFFRPSNDKGSQANIGASRSLIKHRPAILANDSAKMVQTSVGRGNDSAKMVQTSVGRGNHRRLDDNYGTVQNVPNRTVMRNPPTGPLGKRQRTLSGIYPINPAEPKPKQTYHYIQSGLGIRNADGTYSKINALVRKPLPRAVTAPNQSRPLRAYKSPQQIHITDDVEGNRNIKTPEYNFQDVFTNTISAAYNAQNGFVNTVTYTQTSTPAHVLSTAQPNCSVDAQILNEKENFFDGDDYATYSHKKIRAERVRSRRESAVSRKENEAHLPRIHEVFSSFNNVVAGPTGPVFVLVGDEASKFADPPAAPVLEALFNLRAGSLLRPPRPPLPPLAPAADTSTVYSTPVLTTAVAQASSFAPNAQFHLSHDYQSEGLANDYPNNNYSYFRHSPVQSHSTTSSLEMLASQVEDINSSRTVSLTAAESIPDMVEDALELISQDGDYMERIEMDGVSACPLCSWAGPRALLDHHIRQEHADDITQFWTRECRVACSLTELARGVARPLRKETDLFILRASLAREFLIGSLHSVSNDEDSFKVASLSTYNRTTGEPHSWTGLVPPLSDDPPLPDDPPQALRVKLGELGLDTSQPPDQVFVSFYVVL